MFRHVLKTLLKTLPILPIIAALASAVRLAGDQVQLVAAYVAEVGGVTTILVGVVLGTHPSPAAPVLVAHSPEPDLPRLFPAVGAT